jgi:hypothetical protein
MKPIEPAQDHPVHEYPVVCRKRWTVGRIIMTLLVVGLIGGLAYQAFIYIGWAMMVPSNETRIGNYESTLQKWDRTGVTEHFPREIPEGARDVHFYSHPAFMQGGAVIQLRYTTSAEEIAALHEVFSAIATASHFGGDSNDHKGIPTTAFYSNDPYDGPEDHKFPDDYEVMVFGDRCIDEGGELRWNHGRTCGVAISKQRNTIVYWAEAW